jgi:hypothetical protein
VAAVLVLVLSLLAPGSLAASGTGEARVDTFSYEGVARVQVLDGQIFSVEVLGVAGGTFEAEVHEPSGSRVGIEHRRSGDTVMIRTYRKRSLFGIDSAMGSHRLVLKVPRSCELEIATGTGHITVAGVDGLKKLEAGTGPIALERCSGDTVGTTGTGSQRYSDVRGDLAVQTGTGGVSLAQVEGAAEIETATGSIEATGLRLTGDSSFSADTGSITLALAQSLEEITFQLRSDTGKIVVGESEARGRLVVAGGPIRLEAQTQTGGIRIEGQ